MNKDPIPNNTQDSQIYLSLLTYDPDGVIAKLPNSSNIIQRLKEINAEYHEVFNGDLTVADWKFIQEPPTNHGKSVSYIKDDQKIIS